MKMHVCIYYQLYGNLQWTYLLLRFDIRDSFAIDGIVIFNKYVTLIKLFARLAIIVIRLFTFFLQRVWKTSSVNVSEGLDFHNLREKKVYIFLVFKQNERTTISDQKMNSVSALNDRRRLHFVGIKSTKTTTACHWLRNLLETIFIVCFFSAETIFTDFLVYSLCRMTTWTAGVQRNFKNRMSRLIKHRTQEWKWNYGFGLAPNDTHLTLSLWIRFYYSMPSTNDWNSSKISLFYFIYFDYRRVKRNVELLNRKFSWVFRRTQVIWSIHSFSFAFVENFKWI